MTESLRASVECKVALAAIDRSGSPETDKLLAETAHRLKRDGYRVGGVVQTNVTQSDRCRCDMILEELTSGTTLSISQQLGSGSRGCRLDSAALEHIVGLVENTLEGGLDILILNRFGKQEAEGKGFATTLAKALDVGVPVLITINQDYTAAWHRFCGAEGDVLQPNQNALDHWIAASLLSARPS